METPFTLEPVEVRGGRSVIMTPSELMRFDRPRLDRVQLSTDVSDVERKLIAGILPHRPSSVVFRARGDDGEELWRFDETFDDEDLVRAGYVMAIGLLPIWRRLAHGGVTLMVHCGWGVRECYAMREGVVRAARDRKAGTDDLNALDGWILRHMVLHVALDHTHVLEKLLPMQLGSLDRRLAKVARLIDAVPPTLVG